MTPGDRDLRVLFLTTAYPAYAGDPRGHHVHNLARQLVGSGVDITSVAPILPGASLTENIDGVEVHRFRYSPFGREQLAKGVSGIVPNLKAKPQLAVQIAPMVLQMGRAARRLVASHDVLHAHWMYPGGFVGLRVGRNAGIPVVVTAHGGDVNAAVAIPALRLLVRRVGNSVDRVLTVSDDLAAKLRSIGVKAQQIDVVPLGVDTAEPRDRSQVRSIPRVLFVGSLIRRKAVDTLIRALQHVPSGSMEVEIIGDGPERKHLEEMAHATSVPVIFRGAMPPHEVSSALANTDCLVLPSRSEGRPVVVMEAMAAGLPVVASDIPGTRELVSHGETGLLFQLDDAQGLADTLSQLAADPTMRDRLGAAGRQSLTDRGLTGQAAAERHLAVYRSVSAGSVSPPSVGPHGSIDG